MAKFFQNIRNKITKYDRPNQKWVCGKVCEGSASCYFGPDNGGNCQAGKTVEGRVSGECLPRKQGARWVCTRQDSHGGEYCKAGPLPDGSCCRTVTQCVPRLSLRTIRGRVTLAVTIATAGLLIALLWGGGGSPGQPPTGLSAGPLSTSHTFLSNECSKCHSQLQLTPDKLKQFHSTAFNHRALDDGGLCLKCHTEIGGRDGSLAFLPHSAPVAALQTNKPAATDSRPDVVLATASLLTPKELHSQGAACSTCHQEHHGLEASLKDLSNHQCQVCHSAQFKSFGQGHPEFRSIGYPYNRRTRIYFDHYSHYEDHFLVTLKKDPATVPSGFNKDTPHAESSSCASCHVTNSGGGQMTVISFEAACAKCHSGDVFGGKRVPMLAMPNIDEPGVARVFKEKASKPSLDAGAWKNSPDAVDLPWPMLQLLDYDARESWVNLHEHGIELADLSKATAENRQDIANVLWGIKSLMFDLSAPSDGHDNLRRRLIDGDVAQSDVLVRGLPPNVFDGLRKASDQAVLDGSPSTSANLDKMLQEAEAHRAALEEERKADLDKAFSSTSPKAPSAELGSPANTPMPTVSIPPSTAGNLLGASPPVAPAAPPSGNLLGASPPVAPAAPPSGNLLGASPPAAPAAPPSGKLLGTPPPAAPAAPSWVDLLGTTPPVKPAAPPSGDLLGTPPPAAPPGPDAAAKPGESVAARAPALEPDAWASSGGWQEEKGVIYYKSTGHADPVIRGWIEEMVAQSRRTDRIGMLTLLKGLDFQKGVKSAVSGRCFKCHTVDEQLDATGKVTALAVNWKSYGNSEPLSQDLRALSKFKHSSHLLSTSCRSCHSTVTTEAGRLGYQNSFPAGTDDGAGQLTPAKTNAKEFHSNFGPLSKAACAQCHQENGAGNRCVQCHLYHLPPAGDYNPMLDRLRLRDAPPVAGQ